MVAGLAFVMMNAGIAVFSSWSGWRLSGPVDRPSRLGERQRTAYAGTGGVHACGSRGRLPGSAAKPGYAAEPRMKLTLTDESLLPDLLSFLRKEGCVAYYESGEVEAVRPHSFGAQEAS